MQPAGGRSGLLGGAATSGCCSPGHIDDIPAPICHTSPPASVRTGRVTVAVSPPVVVAPCSAVHHPPCRGPWHRFERLCAPGTGAQTAGGFLHPSDAARKIGPFARRRE